jgi:hypothetical protein
VADELRCGLGELMEEGAREMVKRLEMQVAALRKALTKYADCRHGCVECFCTLEARAALWERK